MAKGLKRAAIIVGAFIVALAAAQLIRPDQTNPSTDPTRTIRAHMGNASPVVAVVDRACRDCHSNETRWPSYARVAPLSWLMAYGVKKGRSVVNFSEWGAYAPEQRQALLLASCEDTSNGKMPGSLYTFLNREARLSSQDIEEICAAARQTPLRT